MSAVLGSVFISSEPSSARNSSQAVREFRRGFISAASFTAWREKDICFSYLRILYPSSVKARAPIFQSRLLTSNTYMHGAKTSRSDYYVQLTHVRFSPRTSNLHRNVPNSEKSKSLLGRHKLGSARVRPRSSRLCREGNKPGLFCVDMDPPLAEFLSRQPRVELPERLDEACTSRYSDGLLRAKSRNTAR